jgi:hypothetical protein
LLEKDFSETTSKKAEVGGTMMNLREGKEACMLEDMKDM